MTLTRRVGLIGAVGIGVGAMLGAGVFAVWGPATARAGEFLVWAVVLAGVVGTLNALSTAQLAAHHPVAGGAYTFGRREVHDRVGFVAGIGFVVGKTASIAAIALAIGSYVWPAGAPWVAAVAIAAAWGLNARGITRTAAVATSIAVGVVLALGVFLAVASSAHANPAEAVLAIDLSGQSSVFDAVGQVLAGAALVFFAFAGYARIATLGEEVENPARTIPRAILLALAVVLVVYGAVATTLLAQFGAPALSESSAPLVDLVDGSAMPTAAVSIVAATAAFGSLLALMAGVGRTAMAMAREGDLPRLLARQGRHDVPWRAEGVSALAALVLVAVGDLGFAIAMSSFAVLVYYGVANLAAARARRAGHVTGLALWPGVSVAGVAWCAALAVALPWPAIIASAGALGVAVGVREVVRRHGM